MERSPARECVIVVLLLKRRLSFRFSLMSQRRSTAVVIMPSAKTLGRMRSKHPVKPVKAA